jgi:hypothetical protein
LYILTKKIEIFIYLLIFSKQINKIINYYKITMSKNASSSSKSSSSKMYCKVCHDAGKSEAVYTSHFIRESIDPNSKVLCPTLLALECRFCFCKGHTVKYCSALKRRNSQRLRTNNNEINNEKTTNNNSDSCCEGKLGTREAHFGVIPPEILEELSNSKPYTYASALTKPVVSAPVVSAPVVSELVVLAPVTATSPINRDTTPKPNIVTPWRRCIQRSWADDTSSDEDEDM